MNRLASGRLRWLLGMKIDNKFAVLRLQKFSGRQKTRYGGLKNFQGGQKLGSKGSKIFREAKNSDRRLQKFSGKPKTRIEGFKNSQGSQKTGTKPIKRGKRGIGKRK